MEVNPLTIPILCLGFRYSDIEKGRLIQVIVIVNATPGTSFKYAAILCAATLLIGTNIAAAPWVKEVIDRRKAKKQKHPES